MNNVAKGILLTPFNLFYKISPRRELALMFRLKQGRKLDLKNPRSYNEKLQWLKLYDKNPLKVICSDKYAVRDFIEQEGYGHILNKLLWQGTDPEQIPFDELPNRFVIKVTHGSSFNIICDDKSQLDRKKAIRNCRRWLKAKFLPCYGEWWYGKESPRIVVEEFLEGDNGLPLFDYKFFCFNGEPKMIYVDTWKDGKHAINACDLDLNRFDGVSLGYPCDDTQVIQIPREALDEMLRISRGLAKKFIHVRVDLYYTHGKIYFGELTFSKGAGFDKIRPYSFDEKMGDWMQLPQTH